MQFNPSFASRGSDFKANSITSSVLRVTGVHFNSIETVREICISSAESDEAEKEIRRLAPRNILTGTYTTGCGILEAFARTMCGGRFAETRIPFVQGMPLFQKPVAYLSVLLNSEAHEKAVRQSGDVDRYFNEVFDSTGGRSFFTMLNGYIGLALQYARLGDHVCVLLGCSSPMILRSIEDDHYTVVDQSYVYGLIEVEALLEPLPLGLTQMEGLDNGDSLSNLVFVNSSAEQVYYGDP